MSGSDAEVDAVDQEGDRAVSCGAWGSSFRKHSFPVAPVDRGRRADHTVIIVHFYATVVNP